MKKWVVDFSKWQVKHLPWPTAERIRTAVFANNDEVSVYYDIAGHMIINCENRPADIVECGIYWKELEK